MLIGSCLDLASPSRGRIVAASNCSLSAGQHLATWQEQLVIINNDIEVENENLLLVLSILCGGTGAWRMRAWRG